MKRKPDEDDEDAVLKVPKIEDEEFEIKQEMLDESYEASCSTPSTSTSAKPISAWRPNIKSLDELLLEDWGKAGDDEDLQLGKSALFDDSLLEQAKRKQKPPQWFPPENDYEYNNDWLDSEEDEEDYPPLDSPSSENSKNCLATWKTEVKSLDDQLLEEKEGEDGELKLGTSILFDEKEEEPDVRVVIDTVKGRRQLARYQIRRAIGKEFLKDRHMSIESMLKIAETYSVSYKTLFDDFENRRQWYEEVCEPGDTCCLVRGYFEREMEIEPLNAGIIGPEIRKNMENEFDKHIASKKRLTVGYVHLLCERTGLLPGYLRTQFSRWKSRLLDRNIPSIAEWRVDNAKRTCNLSFETIKILEEAYINKKYKSGSQEWSEEELTALSSQFTGLTNAKILNWMENRQDAGKGKVKSNEPSVLPFFGTPTFISPPQRKMLLESFDSCRNKKDLELLAQKVKLPVKTVTNFYGKTKHQQRQRELWDEAKKELASLDAEKIQMMEALAKGKRKTAYERSEHARQIGVSYDTLTSFINYRKAAEWRIKHPTYPQPKLECD